MVVHGVLWGQNKYYRMGGFASVRFRVATYNVNSIRRRLHIVIPWLSRNRPDILCMQETKVSDEMFPEGPFREIGYNVVYRGSGGYNGVAIASLEKLGSVSYGLYGSDEDRLVRGEYGEVKIVNTYVPQGYRITSEKYRYKIEWFRRLRRLFEENYDPEDLLLWCGDMNVAPEEIDVHDPRGLRNHVDFHVAARHAYKKVLEWGFIDVFRKHHPGEPGQYTFFDYRGRDNVVRGKGWRVDHILATKPLADRSIDSYIDLKPRLMEKPSDHTVLVAEFIL